MSFLCYNEYGGTDNEKRLSKEIIEGKIMITKEEVELEDGNHAFREVLYHHGGVCVLAIVDNQILLVKQFHYTNNQHIRNTSWKIRKR